MIKRLAFVAVPLVFVLALGWATFARGTGPKVGDPAPAFVLPSMAGRRVGLLDFKGRPVFLNFWASWCVGCREEAPDLALSWERYRGTDLAMVGINSQDLLDDAHGYITRNGLGYLNLRDPAGTVKSLYGVPKMPESFLIDRTGKIVGHVYGPMTAGEMKSRFDDLLAR